MLCDRWMGVNYWIFFKYSVEKFCVEIDFSWIDLKRSMKKIYFYVKLSL